MSHLRPYLLLALSVALAASACGGAAGMDADAAFRQIQVHEATVAHRAAEVDACEPGAACPAAEELCEAAERLCGIAGELDDGDAAVRCELARRQCEDASNRGETP